ITAVVLLAAVLLTGGGAWARRAFAAPRDEAKAGAQPQEEAKPRAAGDKAGPVEIADPDTDGDGLPDFQETHKYRTDPQKKDTAGKGGSDGDWQQRREFTYSVRAVVRVMPPYNLKAMNDDYQDVRVISETKDYVELEVVAYPLNTNGEAIQENARWQQDAAAMNEYLAPGVTTNWDPEMRKSVVAELEGAGIVLDRLTDKQ